MKYAVIQTGGKQYKVHEGDVLQIERLKDLSEKSEVVFSDVLLVAGDGQVRVGTPNVAGVIVKGVFQSEVRGPKIHVMKYKAKVRHRRRTGHRQKLSEVLIQSIGERKSVPAARSVEPKKAVTKKVPSLKKAT